MMRVGVAADHGGFTLKEYVTRLLRQSDHEAMDFGALELHPDDDYLDFVIPLAQALTAGDIERGIALCGSGIGACIAAKKVKRVRAGVIHNEFSAHQGVEDDNMNLMCLGGHVIGDSLAGELLRLFLAARFTGVERRCRRIAKVAALEAGHDLRQWQRYADHLSKGS